MDTVVQDLRYAARTLTKQRGFTAIAIVCLALGIGVNTVIFSCLNAILLRPFPYAEPNALVVVTEGLPRQGQTGGTALSYPDFVDYAAATKSFVSMGAYASRTFTLTGMVEPERVEGARVSASMFPTLGIAPARGRGLLPADDREGAPRVALISDGLWERRFGRDPDVVGRAIEIDGGPATIVGVMPPDVRFPGRADLWLPHARSVVAERDNHYLRGIGRLAPGSTLSGARAELETIGRQLATRYPDTNQGWAPNATTLRDAEVGDIRPVLLIMQAAVTFVLLIACANVANLLMARGSSRHREIAIRTTLGAARGRIIRQLLTESLMLALAAGLLGTLMAGWGLDIVTAMLPDSLPSWMHFAIDARVLVFTLLISLATGIVFGLMPALQVSKPDLTDSLKDGGRGAGVGRRSRQLRSVLVVVEVSLSMVLLIGASLMMKSFLQLQSVDPGFDYRRSLAMQISFTGASYDSVSARQATLDRVVTEVAALPGVTGAAAVSLTPLTSANATTGFFVDGETLAPDKAHGAEIRSITPEYFRALKIGLVRGRTFTSQEMMDGALVTVVNQTLASRYWPNEDPLGKRMRWGVTTDDPAPDHRRRRRGCEAAPAWSTAPIADVRPVRAVPVSHDVAPGRDGRRSGRARVDGSCEGPRARTRTAALRTGDHARRLWAVGLAATSVWNVVHELRGHRLDAGGGGRLQRHRILGDTATARDRRPHGVRRAARRRVPARGVGRRASRVHWSGDRHCRRARDDARAVHPAVRREPDGSVRLRRDGVAASRDGVDRQLPAGPPCGVARSSQRAQKRLNPMTEPQGRQ